MFWSNEVNMKIQLEIGGQFGSSESDHLILWYLCVLIFIFECGTQGFFNDFLFTSPFSKWWYHLWHVVTWISRPGATTLLQILRTLPVARWAAGAGEGLGALVNIQCKDISNCYPMSDFIRKTHGIRDDFESLSYKTCAFSSSRMDSELTLRCLASTVLPVLTNLLFEVGNWQAIQLKSLKSCAWRWVAIKGVPKMLQFSCLTSPNDGWTSAIFEKRSWVHIIFDPFWSILLGSSFRVQVSPKFAPGGYSKKSVM